MASAFFQPEKHDIVVIIVVDRHERRLMRVQRINLYLIIDRVNFHEAQSFIAQGPDN